MKIIWEFALYDLWGWEIVGLPPDLSQYVIAVAPHRKGLGDVARGWLVKEILEMPPPRFLVKYEAMKPWPKGLVLKKIGGIFVDRHHDAKEKLTGYSPAELVQLLKDNPYMTLVFTPQGTRNDRAPWQRGFYVVSLKTGLPIILVAFDYVNKRVVIDAPFYPSGNLTEDLAYIDAFYARHTPDYKPVFDLNIFQRK